MPKLISWNIACRIKVRSEQLAWIASEKADILALQEVARASGLQQSLSDLGFGYFASTEPTDGRKKLVAIASREPLTVISVFTVPFPERAISCRISLKGEEVELHCVSVPPGSQYGGVKVEFLEALTSGISTRDLPQLLVGDFNCPQVMEPEVVTWAQTRGKDNKWRLIKTFRGIDGKRWDEAERKILCPRADMKDAYRFLNGISVYTYPAKVKGGPNCFDHMIGTVSIMPSRIRVVGNVAPKLSDHAALVAEW
jgi:endonuclease/exonuclease/phosphatase family metal-dependent hydrolase